MLSLVLGMVFVIVIYQFINNVFKIWLSFKNESEIYAFQILLGTNFNSAIGFVVSGHNFSKTQF